MTGRSRLMFGLLAAGLVAPTLSAARQLAAGQPVVVLPFDNTSRDGRVAWLREGAAMLLTDVLEASGEDVIDRAERLRAFERLQLPAGAVLSRASAIRVGRVLGAGSVIFGSVESDSSQLRVRARTIRLDTGRLLPEVAESGPLADPFALFHRVVRRLRASAEDGPSIAWPPSPQAFEFYVKGLVADAVQERQALFDRALALAPSYDRARLALWDLLMDQGDHQRALETVAGDGRSTPHAPELRFAEAVATMALGRLDQAFAQLRQLHVERRSAPTANALGVVQLRRSGTTDEGRATYFFKQAVDLDSTDADYCFNLGYAYWLERDPSAALYWLREAVRRDPTDADAHFLLGSALHQTGAPAEAAREATLATQLSSRYDGRDVRAEAAPRGLERLHDHLTQVVSRVDATITNTGLRDQQAAAEFHLDVARRAYDRQADREAMAALRRAVFLSPYLAEAHVLIGRLHLQAGSFDEARAALSIALWSDETPDAHVAMAEVFVAQREPEHAKAELERALALDPTFAPALVLREKLR